MFLPFLSIPLILDIVCIVHIIKADKDRVWLFVVVFIPVIGSIAYIITELVPSLLHARKAREMTQVFSNSIFGNKKIAELETLVKIADTYQNKYALAEAYLAVKNYSKAVETLISCRSGIYSDDPHLLQAIANTYALEGDWINAKAYFDKVSAVHQLDKKYRAVYARSLVYAGDTGKAEEIYKELEKENHFEGIYAYAGLLEETGRPDEAKAKYERIAFIASTVPRFVYRENRKWIDLAKDAMNK